MPRTITTEATPLIMHNEHITNVDQNDDNEICVETISGNGMKLYSIEGTAAGVFEWYWETPAPSDCKDYLTQDIYIAFIEAHRDRVWTEIPKWQSEKNHD
jgi:hypothetical protein